MPVHLVSGPVDPRGIVHLDFYVLQNDAIYNLIFGRTMLMAVKGLLDVYHHRIQYTTPAGSTTATTIPLSKVKR